MQTPQGYTMADGRFEPANWLAIIFNPSFPYRLLHNVTAFYITTAFVVMGVGAFLLRRGRAAEDARMMIRMALDLLIILVPLQIFLGDQHGLNTLEYQPAKLAAIEGRYDTAQPAPLTLFGIPDDATATMRYAIDVPYLGSIILTHSLDGVIKGLKEWPADQRPPVGPPFFAFRIMVGIAFIMLFMAVVGQALRLRGERPVGRALVLVALPMDSAARLHRRSRRLDHHGGRPSALDDLWAVPHGGLGLALAHRERRRHLARALYRRLPHHVPDRDCVHGRVRAPRSARANDAAGGRRKRPAGPPVRKRCTRCVRNLTAAGGAMVLDLVPLWTILLGLAVFYYVVFDGFDLGVGMLYGFVPSENEPWHCDELDRAGLGRQ